jgi:hypothetical protein
MNGCSVGADKKEPPARTALNSLGLGANLCATVTLFVAILSDYRRRCLIRL